MKRILNQPLLYTLLALIYLVSTSLFPGGNTITKLSHLGYVILSIYYFIRVVTEFRQSSYMKALNMMVFLVLCYGLVLFYLGSDSTWQLPVNNREFLRSHIQSIFPIYAFYFFSAKKMVSQKWFRWIFIIFLMAAIFHYLTQQSMMLFRTGRDEMTNNVGYMFLGLMPAIAFYKNKPVLLYSIVCIVIAFIIMSMKRGAILIGCLCVVYILLHTINSSNRNKWMVVVFSITVIVFVAHFVNNMLSNSSYFVYRVEQTLDGDSSNRWSIYARYFDFFINPRNLFSFIFGNGAYGTCHYLGLMAHNDWLEYAIDFGVIGLIAYAIYWHRAYQLAKYSRTVCPIEISLCVVLFIGIYFLTTLFSMSFMSMEFYATSVFGYCVAKIDILQNNPNAEIE